MIDLNNYNVLSVLYEDNNSKFARICKLDYNQKEILKIVRKRGSSLDNLSSLKHEFKLLKSLNKHVCRHIISVKKLLDFEQESCLVLEDVDGIPLMQLCNQIRESYENKIEKILEIAIDLVEAIEHIHWIGMVHNDLRSDRILVNIESLNVVIMDFSCATPIEEYGIEPDKINKLDRLYPYISPERTSRTRYKVDQRSDLYSLGIILYEVFSGALPFGTKEISDLVHCHMAVNPLSLAELIPNFPIMISFIVQKLMMKELTDRYQSANILKSDLVYCLKMWKLGKDIPIFELGRNDYFGNINFPNKLYGRDKEISYMKEWFGRSKQEKTSMLLISGYSGIGKSTLVEKSCEYYVSKKAFLVKGKFEQSKKEIPYFALSQLFAALINKVMKEKILAEEIAKKCIEELGEQAGALVPLISNLEKLLGKQNEAMKIDPKQSENRMNYALGKLLKTFTAIKRPIIFFVDDIQWADDASIDMISNILNMELANTFLICAYRENEVEQQYQLKKTIKLWQQEFKAEVLRLKSLERDYIEEFVADSLHMKSSEVEELACVIQEKTQGNIFFTRQFLMFLQNKGMLYLYSEKNEVFDYQWHWNIKDIANQCPTENVIDIILENLRLMTNEELNVIKIAACIGNSFEVNILASVCDKDIDSITSILFNFWKAEMITYEANQPSFSHDRIHQAIYSTISHDELRKIHLKIGKVMLEVLPIDIQKERIFDIVSHWNEATSQIEASKDIILATKINLEAARKAKENSAYIEAKNYAQKAFDLLSMSVFDLHNKLMLELYDEMSEINFLIGEHAESYSYTEKALSIAETVEEKFKAFQVRVQIQMARSQLREAINIAFKYVELLGEKIDLNASENEIRFALTNIKNELGINPVKKLEKLPRMSSYRNLIAIKMLSYVITSAYMISPRLNLQIVIKIIELSLKYGIVSEAIVAWVYYGVAFVYRYGQLETGYEICETALELRSKVENQEIRSKFTFIVLMAHRKLPIRSILNDCLELYDEGLKIGDIEDSCQGLLQYGNMAFHAGCELTELKKELLKMYKIVEGYKQKTVHNRLSITLQVIINLCQSNKPYVLCGRVFDESEMLQTFHKLHDSAAIFIWASQRIMLCCLFHKYDEIDEAVNLVEKYNVNTPSQVFEFNYHYYFALCKLRKIKIDDKMKEQEILKHMEKNFKKVEDWIHKSEANYIHKYMILNAEFNRAAGKISEAIQLYTNAIQNASENHFIQDAAFALELLGLCYLEMKNQIVAEIYLQKAIEYYEKWGAFTKVEHIKAQFFSKEKDKLEFKTNIKTNEANIDLHSILLAAQTLSEEIEINSLIKKMLEIVMINSGATKALFLEYKKGNLVVETGCIAETYGDRQENDSIQFIKSMKYQVLPWSLIDYTIIHRKLILSDHPLEDSLFSEDLYIQQEKPKSVFCIPLNRKNDLLGIIYLENKIFSGAFTSKQIEVIKMLSVQIVISLENARLYSNLEEKVMEATLELKDTVRKLKSEISERKNAEKALYENEERLREVKEYDKLKTEFFANISHELKTPLNVIYGAIQMCNVLIEKENSYKENSMYKYTQMIKQNCHRLTRLINNIIDITKIDSGYIKLNLKNEDIVNVVESIVMSVVSYAETKGISIIFDTDVEEKIIACDTDKIERIILNLLSNSIKFTDNTGKIYVNIFDKEKSVIISIKDTGIGIPKEKLNIIFERFMQVDKSISRNSEGSGIGLSLVKELVSMHNGTISVNSNIGEGSEFILELPVHITNDNITYMKKCEDKESSKIERINIEFSDIYF